VLHFTEPQRVVIAEHLRTKAQAYATAVRGTVNYADSAQTGAKVRGDHFNGKLGEEAVRLVAHSFGLEVTGPDYAVYAARGKSWAHDLGVDGTPLHVKTQTVRAALLYGLSWMFQDSSKRSDTALNQLEDWTAFVLLNEAIWQAVVYPPQQMRALTFSAPALAHLRGKKQVVYAREQRWFNPEWAAL
jgi:hypothetical protein